MLLLSILLENQPFWDRLTELWPCGVLSSDGSYKVLKHLMKLGGRKVFALLHTGLNEFEHIRIQGFLPDDDIRQIGEMVKSLQETLKANGSKSTELVNDDNCCHTRGYFENWLPTLRSCLSPALFFAQTSGLLPYQLTRDIRVVTQADTDTVDRAIKDYIFGPMISNPSLPKFVAIDCEWTTSKSGHNPTALVQLCGPLGDVVILHLSQMRRYSRRNENGWKPYLAPLAALLARKDIAKVGLNIAGDLAHLRKFYGIKHVESDIDIREMIYMKGLSNTRNGSLVDAAALILKRSLSKEQQRSNWDAEELSDRQREYAATDVAVVADIFNKINPLPNTGLTLLMNSAACVTGANVDLISRMGDGIATVAHAVITQVFRGDTAMRFGYRFGVKLAVVRVTRVLAPATSITLREKVRGPSGRYEVRVHSPATLGEAMQKARDQRGPDADFEMLIPLEELRESLLDGAADEDESMQAVPSRASTGDPPQREEGGRVDETGRCGAAVKDLCKLGGDCDENSRYSCSLCKRVVHFICAVPGCVGPDGVWIALEGDDQEFQVGETELHCRACLQDPPAESRSLRISLI